MALILNLSTVSGPTRSIEINPGDSITLAPGEFIDSISGDGATQVELILVDGNLQVVWADGQINLPDYGERPLPEGVTVRDENSGNQPPEQGNDGPQGSAPDILTQTDGGDDLPENFVLPENQDLPGQGGAGDQGQGIGSGPGASASGSDTSGDSDDGNNSQNGNGTGSANGPGSESDSTGALLSAMDLGPAEFSVNPVSVREGANAIFTITRAGNLSSSATIEFTTLIQSDDTVSGTTSLDFIDSTGSITFTPGQVIATVSIATNADILGEGIETFSFKISSEQPETEVVINTPSVKASILDNTDPTAANDAAAINEDANSGSLNTTILANDDPQDLGDSLRIIAVDNTGTTGTASLNGGTLSYTASGFSSLASGITANDTFTYTISDDGNATATATVTMTITGVNDAPVANPDSGAATEDGVPVILTEASLIANDTDVDVGDTRSIQSTAATSAAGAAITFGGGNVTYNPGALFQTLAQGATTTDTFTYTLVDSQGATSNATVIMTITGVNDNPVANPDGPGGAFAATEDGGVVSLAGTSFTVNDTDVDVGDLLTVTGVSATSVAGASVTLVGTNVQYDPGVLFQSLGQGDSTTDTFTYTIADGKGGTANATTTLTINGVNDAPTATNLNTAQNFTEDAPLTLSAISVGDVDSANVTATLSLSTPAAGSLTTATAGAVTSTYNASVGVWSASGALLDINTLLAGVTFTPTPNFATDFTITTSVSDGIAAPVTGSKVMTAVAVNDAPTATNLNVAEAYTEDTPLNLTNIVVSDIDSGNVTATLTLSSAVAGSLSTATSGAVTSTYNAGTGVWQASGVLADVNTLLAGLTFTPAADFNTNFNIATSVDDGVAPALTGSKSFTGTAVNDAPTATNLNTADIYVEDTPLNLTDIVISDVDSTNVTATLTLSNLAAGSLSTATSGAVTSAFNVGTGTWSASGAVTDVNALLVGVTFTPTADFNANFSIATAVDDGVVTITGSKALTGTPVNDAPTATNLSTVEIYTEDTPLDLTDIVVSDIDSAIMTVTLTLSNAAAGALSTATSGAVISTYNAGSGVWNASGLTADVNTLLSGVTFTPAADFNANFNILTSVDDGIAPPVAGAKAMIGTPVNDAPTASNLNTPETFTEDIALDFSDITISDIDSANVTATLTLSTAAAGALSTAISGVVASNYNAVTGVWAASGALVDVNTLLAGLTFTPAADFESNFTIATSIADGTAPPVLGTKSVSAIPVNDAPTVSNLAAAETYSEDTPLNLMDIVIIDPDAGDTLTATLTLSNVAAGALSTATSGAVTSTYNAGTGVWSANGALADVNTLLAGVLFTPALDFTGPFNVSTFVADASGASVGGTKVFTGTPVNDAPSASNLAATEVFALNTPRDLIDIVVSDVDNANTTVTLTMSNPAAGTLSTATSNLVTSTFDGTTWSASGAISDVNTLLAGVIYTPAAGFGANIATDVFDLGVAITDGVDTTLGTKLVTPRSNLAPTATNLSAAQAFTEDTPLNLTDIVISDGDTTALPQPFVVTALASLTLSNIAAGSLSTATSNAVTSTYNVGTGVWQASGLLDDVNTLLAGVVFNPTADFDQDFTIATLITDGIAAPVTGTKTMTAVPVNDAPTATNLNAAEAYTEDTPLNLTDIVIADVDSANVTATLTLSTAAAGALSTAASNAVISTYNAGTGVWSASGALADVNTLLAGVSFTPTADFNANFNIATSVDDGAAPATTGTKVITGIAVNDAPTATNLSAAQAYTEDTVLNLTDIVVSDIDSANVTATLSLSTPAAGALSTATSGAVTSTYNAGSGLWSASGALTDVNTLLAAVTFTPAADFNASFNIVTSVDDGVAPAITGSKSITGTAVNDAPTATNLNTSESYTEDSPVGLTGIVITDVDSANLTATLTLSNAAAGVLSTATSGAVISTYDPVTGVWTASGALGDVNSLLGGVIFTPTADFDANFNIATSVDDGVAPVVTGSKSVTATPINDAPLATNLNTAVAYTEDTPVNASSIVITDVDSANVTASLTLSTTAAGALSTTTSGAVTSTYSAGTGIWSASGALADVNSLLAGVMFTPTADFNSNFTIATSVDDGVAGALTGNQAVTGTAVNDAPTATNLSAGENYTEDTSLNLTDIVIADVDSANVTATLTVSNPAAGALSAATSGLVTSTYNAGSGVWSASGAVADVNNLLTSVTFTPAANFTGSFNIATSVDDGVATAITGTKTVTGTAINDAPTATNLSAGETYTEDTPLDLTDIVITDVDSPTVSATLTVSNPAAGTLSTATSNAVISTYNAGTGVWSASGVLADVNTLLAGVTLTPSANFNANFNIATVVDDGVAPPLTGNKAITGTAVNDAPTATNLNVAEAYTEDTALILTDIVVSDIDSATVTATLTLSTVAAGTLSTATSGAVTSLFAAGVWTANGALADVNTLLAGVVFNPAADFNADFSIATSVDDGAAAAITGTKLVTGTAVNDAPTALNLSAGETYTEDAPLDLTDIVITDVDSANVTATLTLSNTAAGTLSTATSNAVISSYNAGTGVWGASGALTDVNTLLAGVTFTPTADFESNFSIATSVDDGTAPAVTGSKIMTAIPQQDAPTATNLAAGEGYTEDTPLNLTDIVITDPDAGDTITATLTLSNLAAGTLSTATSGAVTSTFGAGVWSASGALVDVNALLAGVVFTPTTDFEGDFSIATSVDDGVAAAITGAKAMTATPVNDIPTATNLSAGETYTEDLSLNLTDIVITDPDVGDTLTATLTLSNSGAGLLSVGTSNLVISTFDGTTWTASGAINDVNTLLAGVTFTPTTNFESDFSIATSVNDGTAPAVTGTKIMTATPQQDAPLASNLAAGEAYTEDTPLNLTDIVITDPDAGDTLTATLILSTAAAGALSTATLGAVTSTYNAGTGEWSAIGALADVNALLAGVVFTPTANFESDFSIATSVDDGVAVAITGNKVMTATPQQDAPVATNLDTAEGYISNPVTPVNLADIVITDPDVGDTLTATLILSNAAAGALSTATSGLVASTYNVVSGEWRASGALTDVNTLLAGVVFTPTLSFASAFTIDTFVSDGIAPPITGSKSLSPNQPPNASNLNAAQNFTEDTPLDLTDIVITDADSANVTTTLTLSNTAAGALSTATSGSVASTFNAGSGVWSASGALSDVNSLLAGVIFTPNTNFESDFSIATSVTDSASAPVTGTKVITAIPQQDAPMATNLSGAEAYTEDTPLDLIDVVITDPDSADTITATLTLLNNAAGALSTATSGAVTSLFAAGVWSASGALADVNALLAGVVFTPAVNFDADFSIGTSVTDGVIGAPLTGTKAFTATPVNDVPTATNLNAAEVYTEDTPLNLTDIVITDPDLGDTITATLTLSNTAAGALSTATSNAVASIYTAGTGVWSASGALADVNTLLAGVTFTPTLDFNANFTIATSVTDGVIATPLTGIKSVTGTAVNDAPTATNLSAAQTFTEDTPLNLTDIVITDPDVGDTITATLTLSNTAAGALSTATSGAVTSTYIAGTGVWSASGALAAVNTLLAGVVFTPTANFESDFTIATSINDGIAPAVTGNKAITATPVNDVHVATNLNAAEAFIEDTPLNFTDIVITDPDAGDTITATLTLSTAAAGALSTTTSGAVTSTFGAGVWSASGALADVNALLAGVVFIPAANFNSNFGVSTQVDDGASPTLNGLKLIVGTAVNDVPTASNLSAAQTYIEDTPLNLTDIVITDPDIGDTITATLTLSDTAAGALSTATSNAVTSIYTAGTGVWIASGALADVNALLAGVVFTPVANFNTNLNIATSVADGVAVAITGSKSLTGTPVNDAPTVTNLSAGESYTEDTPLDLTDLVITDIDSPTVTATLTLSNGAAGTLSTAISGAVNSNFGAGVWSASGALADVNSLLAGVVFTPTANFNAGFNILTSVSDGSAAAITGSKSVTGTAVNDAPTATNLSAAEAFTEDTPQSLTDIVITDVDSASVTASLTLSNIAAGVLSTATSGAVTSSYNAGTGVWSASGALADVNLLLAGVTFTPAVNFDADFTIATSVDDGVAPTVTGTKAMTAIPVNDAPTASNLNAAQSYTEDAALNLVDIVITDVDSANVTATLTLSNVGAGALSTATSGLVTSTYIAGTGVWTAIGALADVNSLLTGVTFMPVANFTGNFTIATSVSDGAAPAITGSKAITAIPVNDAPTASNLNAVEAYTEDTSLNLTDIVVTDVDSANVTATLTISNAAAGALSTATSNAVSSAYDTGTGVWSASGALADVNILLAGVTFNPATNFNGNFNIATSVNDGVASAVTGSKVVTGTAVNDAPTATNLNVADSYTTDVPRNLSDIVITDVDSATVTATLTLSNPAAGALSTATSGGVTSSFGAGVWSAFGALTDVNTLLAGVTFNPAGGFSADFTIATSVDDGAAPAITGTKSITNSPNLPPSATNLSATESYTEDTPLDLTNIVVSDVDSANVTATLTLTNTAAGSLSTATAGTVTSDYNGVTGVWTASGVLADVNTLLAGVTFTPATDFNAGFNILTSVSDGIAAPVTGSKSITGIPVNDAPTVSNLSAPQNYTEDTPLDLTNIVVADVDSANVTATMMLSTAVAGALSTAISGLVTSTYNVGTGVWSASGALADVNALLAGVTFTPTADFASNFTIATSVTDGASAPVTGIKNLTAIPVNDAPTASNLDTAEAYTEDTVLNLTDIVITDVDSASVTASLTLSNPAAGALSIATSGVVTSDYNVGTGVWSASGALANVNALLAGVVFTPTANLNANFNVATSVSDGVAAAITGNKTFTGTAVNDAPTATNLSAGDVYIEDTAKNLTDIVITDVDSSSVTATLTLSNVAAGALSTATSGAVISTFAAGVWSASGALADVNSLLAGVTFTPVANFDSDFSIATSVTDGASAPVTGTKNITATPVNDAPLATNLNTAEAYTEDTALNLTDIVITDIDSASVTATLTLSNPLAGALSTATSGAVTSTYNVATGLWQASGVLADVNTLLAGVLFNPAADFNGNFNIATSVSDGVATAITGSKAITGAAVNDAPMLADAAPNLVAIDENAGAPGIGAGTAVSDLVDLPGGGGLNNVTDPDGPALGVAITNVDTTIGDWFFSIDNGVIWSDLNTASESVARLLLADTDHRIYLQPNATQTGPIANAITFRVWDQSTGTDGQPTNIIASGGDTAFSSTGDGAAITVNSTGIVVTELNLTALNGLDINADGTVDGLKFNGLRASDVSGVDVAIIGDLNGDGFSDIAIGAPNFDSSPPVTITQNGATYIVFGASTGTLTGLSGGVSGFNLSALNGTQGLTILGGNDGDRVGNSVFSGGDLDGDGYADLLIGDANPTVTTVPQQAYAVLGDSAIGSLHAGGAGIGNGFNVSNLNGSNGANLIGNFFITATDVEVAGGGDVDNDGMDDILVGQQSASLGGANSGTIYLIFGDADGDGTPDGNLNDIDGIDLTSATSTAGVISVNGASANDFLGRTMSLLGDINGDGFDDMLFGATANSGDKGGGYVIFGDTRPSLVSLFDDIVTKTGLFPSGLDSLNGSKGFKLSNVPFPIFNTVGKTVNSIGDFNGDGFDDFVVGAPTSSFSMVTVIFGKASGYSNIDVSGDFDQLGELGNGFRISSVSNVSELGISLSGGGDVNGDGYDDLVIGATGLNHDKAYVLFGTADIASLATDFIDGGKSVEIGNGTTSTFEVGGALEGKGVILSGLEGDNTGSSVSMTGDVNGDGFADILIGAPNSDSGSGGTDSGQTFLVFGQAFTNANVATVNTVASSANEIIIGSRNNGDILSSGSQSGVVLKAGSGDDTLSVNGNEQRVDGGGGDDTMTLATNNLSLDFTSILNNNIYTGIERIDTSGAGTNTIGLDIRDLLDLSDTSHSLFITGDSVAAGDAVTDSVNATGFTDDGFTVLDGSVTYNSYSATNGLGALLIDENLNQLVS